MAEVDLEGHVSQAEEYDCLYKLTGLLFSDKTGSCEWASQVQPGQP